MSKHWPRTIRFAKSDFTEIVKRLNLVKEQGQLIRYEFDRRQGVLRIKAKEGADLSTLTELDRKESEKGEASRVLKTQIRPFDDSTIPDFDAAHGKVLDLFADKVAVGSFECDRYLTLIFKDVRARIEFFKAIKDHTPFLNIKPPINNKEKELIEAEDPMNEGDRASL